jgi:hypothetical protein
MAKIFDTIIVHQALFCCFNLIIHSRQAAKPATPSLQPLQEKRVVEQDFPMSSGIQLIWIGSHADYDKIIT